MGEMTQEEKEEFNRKWKEAMERTEAMKEQIIQEELAKEELSSVPAMKISFTKEIRTPDGLKILLEFEMNPKGYTTLKEEKVTRKHIFSPNFQNEIRRCSPLNDLVRLTSYIRTELRLDAKRLSIQAIAKIATIYLGLREGKKTNPNTGRVSYYPSVKAYNYARALKAISAHC